MSKNGQKIPSNIASLVFGVLVFCFAIGYFAFAWQEPTQSPPQGNVATPINVGSAGQTKGGGLILNTDLNLYGLIVDGDAGNSGGRVGIGVLAPDTKLDVAGDIRLGPGAPTYRIRNVADPSISSDVATKGYVDNQSGGGSWAPSDIKQTSATSRGDLGGWQALYNFLQTNGCSGYHLCAMDEVYAYLQMTGADLSEFLGSRVFAWAALGSTVWADCESWTSGSHCIVLETGAGDPNYFYPLFVQNGCYEERPFLCCSNN